MCSRLLKGDKGEISGRVLGERKSTTELLVFDKKTWEH
jgi:hypothetical protein